MLRLNGLFTEVILREAISTGSPLLGNFFVGGICLPTAESKSLCNKIVEKVKFKKPPPSERLRSLGGGVMYDFVRRKHLRLFVRKCPILRRSPEEPAPQSRFLGAVSFPGYLVRRQEIPKKVINDSEKPYPVFPNKNKLIPFPSSSRYTACRRGVPLRRSGRPGGCI